MMSAQGVAQEKTSPYLSSLLGVIAEYNSNHTQKWGQICCKSVQLVRGSSFRNDFVTKSIFLIQAYNGI